MGIYGVLHKPGWDLYAFFSPSSSSSKLVSTDLKYPYRVVGWGREGGEGYARRMTTGRWEGGGGGGVGLRYPRCSGVPSLLSPILTMTVMVHV